MRYDNDGYLDDEEDKDFWDDELELSSDYPQGGREDADYTDSDMEAGYPPYDDNNYTGESDNNEEIDYYSDPEPDTSARPRRELPSDDSNTEEEENDFFDSDDTPEPVKKTRTPRLDPEDPDYWIEEEDSPIMGIMSAKTGKWKWLLAAGLAIIIIISGIWIWFFRPYADSSVKYGYITNMERRGLLFKTFEGTMIPYKELGDPDPLYFHDLRFSVSGDSLAARMKKMMLGSVPVRVEYETYRSALPWKGEEKMIIVKADTADPRKILPPEYRGRQ